MYEGISGVQENCLFTALTFATSIQTYDTSFYTCSSLHFRLQKKCSECFFLPAPLQRIEHPQTVKFHRESVLSTPATRLLDFRQRIMESCWNAISASQTSEGLRPLPNTGNKGISVIRHLHTRHQGVMSRKETGRKPSCFQGRTADETLAGSQLRVRYPVDAGPFLVVRRAYMSDKYRLKLTVVITYAICCVL